jgi:glycosyltransferase involved in cell wall biosynthesis
MVQGVCAMIRVGFVCAFDSGWLGGTNYFRNLLTALYENPAREIEAIIFVGNKIPSRNLDGLPTVKIVRSRLLAHGSLPWLIRKLWFRTFSRDLFFERLLKKHSVDVLSHSDYLGKNASIPTIGWIPDFQHVRLPEYFSAGEIKGRDRIFHNLCRFCTGIIVSSYDAQSDLQEFAPGCKRKSEVLQFVVKPPEPNVSLPSRKELELRYRFSGNYFLLPNQFWKHKNHRVVIEALGALNREGKRVLVLATGNTEDYRHPAFFSFLMEKAKELGVQDDFRPLGVVPFRDLAALMQYSIAIINPSFFEGWSTTVEEAKSIGKPVLLSDIPVHREQNPVLATYFSPNNPNELAEILWNDWSKPCADEVARVEEAFRMTAKCRLEFSKRYQEIVFKVLENHK